MSSYSELEIQQAFNEAADEILAAISAPDEGVRDALNLLVNAGMYYLDDPDADLDDVIAACYGDEDRPFDWIKDNI